MVINNVNRRVGGLEGILVNADSEQEVNRRVGGLEEDVLFPG